MVHIVIFTILPDSKVWFRCRCCTELSSQPCSLGSPFCACLVPFRQGWWPFYYFSDLFPHNSTITYWTLHLWMGSWSLWRQSLPWDGVVVWMAASLIGLYNCMLHAQLMNSLRRCVTASRLWVLKTHARPSVSPCLPVDQKAELPATMPVYRNKVDSPWRAVPQGQLWPHTHPHKSTSSHLQPSRRVLSSSWTSFPAHLLGSERIPLGTPEPSKSLSPSHRAS